MVAMEKQEFLSLSDDAKYALFQQVQSKVEFLRGLTNGLMDQIPKAQPIPIPPKQPISLENKTIKSALLSLIISLLENKTKTIQKC